MRADRAFPLGAALGLLGDALFGDPRRGHPVAAFGRAAGAVERALWRDHRGWGALHTTVCAGGAVVTGVLLARAARAWDGHRPWRAAYSAACTAPARTAPARTPPACAPCRRKVHSPVAAWPGADAGRPVAAGYAASTGRPAAAQGPAAAHIALTAVATWAVVGGTSLGREARAIGDALAAGDLAAARARLPHLCGRDPQALDERQIARAVVESVAENTSDAVVGALVWGALAGVPGLVGFRAVNTLDAMVGHKSARYRRFGWAAARLDDVAGRPGSRLTAGLAVLAGGNARDAARAWRTDAAKHPSPNAGPVEAAFAGALGVRLGGVLSYGGRVEHRPVLNAAGREVEYADIERAVRLSRRVSLLTLAVCAAARIGTDAVVRRARKARP
ncbi:adenosylcobinamide-phosphate synthase CbiB [Streptomyces sp. PR69]|uniref:adenosylcobinamide-phosphate synthase CbiB n=1 Tax=Streptomyces sp. PR69 TaxID=2984950 RepID=UPI002264C3D6|nr:adenosylcobinamide-phosphate synthase CbiB [Streptomyces sp. PR69]